MLLPGPFADGGCRGHWLLAIWREELMKRDLALKKSDEPSSKLPLDLGVFVVNFLSPFP